MRNSQATAGQYFLPGFEVLDLFSDSEPSTPVVEQQSSPIATLLDDGALVTAAAAVLVVTSEADVIVDVQAEEPEAIVETDAIAAPAADETHVEIEVQAAPRERCGIKARESAPWPLLEPVHLAELGGKVGKFEANLAAVTLLKTLESDAREPNAEERIVLHRYTGWGGLQEVFGAYTEWRERSDRLKAVLSEEELESCRQTVLNAHYTDVHVVQAIWAAVERAGFTGGRILDPSCGTGHFFGAMPQEIARTSEMHAVEIDDISARIHKALYGQASKLQQKGFEKVEFAEKWFDLAISNVPFGKYSVPCGRRKPYSRWSIHNFFMGRMLDLVRPGGLVAIVTSQFFMDAADTSRRAYIHSKAKLVGALRLPAGTFERIAATSVTCDVLIFQRRESGAVPSSEEASWMDVAPLPEVHMPYPVAASQRTKNVYWAEHRGHVLGDWDLVRGQHSQVLVPKFEGEGFDKALMQAVETLPSSIYTSSNLQVDGELAINESPLAVDGKKPGSYVLRNDEVHIVHFGTLERVDAKGAKQSRMRGLIMIRDSVRELLAQQTDPGITDEMLAPLRLELNRLYDAFVAKWGYVFSTANRLAFHKDPDWPLLLSLEHYDEESQTAKKASIFTQRTSAAQSRPTSADSPEDAIAISQSEFGHLNPTYIAQLLSMNPAEVIPNLETMGLAFLNPETGLYESKDEYLSGHIRNKIAVANASGDYGRNVLALTEVLPEDLPPGDIEVRLGSNWVPPSDYEAFVKVLVGGEVFSNTWTTLEVRYEAATGAWAIHTNMVDAAFDATWGTKDIKALNILSSAINGRQVTVRDAVEQDGRTIYVVNVEKTAAAREKQREMEERFRTWLWEDAARASRLVRTYNDEFNSWVDRRYDGSRMRLPGYSWYLSLSEHQLNATTRIATGSNTLLAHCVGAGKTLEMICGAMELRRLKLRKKPLMVVPNHMLQQVAAEFMRAYPNASLLLATKDDLSKERRQEFCARIATGDWDTVVMTHSSFERISAGAELTEAILGDMLCEVKAALSDSKRDKQDRALVKQLVKMEKEWEAKLERCRAEWKKDDFVSLDQLGIDHLLVDEAHLFKNLFRFSQMERVAGLPNVSSQRAFDLFVKTRQLMRMHDDTECGVVFATGTPVANSMAELHVMQRFLQPKTLRDIGLESFDAWAAQFGRVVTTLEVSPDGSSFRMNERFAMFVNLPELMAVFSQVADIKTKEMLKLPTPPVVGGGPEVIATKPSAQLKEYIDTLVSRAEAIRNRSVTPDKDNMLAVTNDGRKAALDVRLVIPGAAFDPQGKIAACVNKAHALWVASKEWRGTQLIFSDLGTPGGAGFDVYNDIKARLVQKGVPENEIAFIHDAPTDTAKAELFKKVREGVVRFLIGSTSKMGIGTNVQTRLFAVHHLDAPWRPADVEQRDGRIERRGNLCEEIYIFRYVTEGSFDAYLWQGLAAKARFIAQIMSGDRSIRRMEDAEASALSYEEVKAIACGNPAVKEKALLDAEYRKLCMLRSHHRKTVDNARWELQAFAGREKDIQSSLAKIAADQEIAEANGSVLVLDGNRYIGDEAKAEALKDFIDYVRENMFGEGQVWVAGTYAGLDLRVSGMQTRYGNTVLPVRLELGKQWVQRTYPYRRGMEMLHELDTQLYARSKDISDLEFRLKSLHRQRPALELQAQQTFNQMGRLVEVEDKLHALEIELGLVKSMEGSEAVDETTTVANKTSLVAVEAEAQVAEA